MRHTGMKKELEEYMKTLQQIQIEQVPIGELRHDPGMKRIEELNRAGMGIAGHILYSFKPRNQVGSHTRISAGFPKIIPNRF